MRGGGPRSCRHCWGEMWPSFCQILKAFTRSQKPRLLCEIPWFFNAGNSCAFLKTLWEKQNMPVSQAGAAACQHCNLSCTPTFPPDAALQPGPPSPHSLRTGLRLRNREQALG